MTTRQRILNAIDRADDGQLSTYISHLNNWVTPKELLGGNWQKDRDKLKSQVGRVYDVNLCYRDFLCHSFGQLTDDERRLEVEERTSQSVSKATRAAWLSGLAAFTSALLAALAYLRSSQ